MARLTACQWEVILQHQEVEIEKTMKDDNEDLGMVSLFAKFLKSLGKTVTDYTKEKIVITIMITTKRKTRLI